MPRFLIERRIPNISQMTPGDLQAISRKSNSVLGEMQRQGTAIQWDHSYLTDDALHCVYVAPDAGAVREHARIGGFPCDNIMQVGTIIDPTTGE